MPKADYKIAITSRIKPDYIARLNQLAQQGQTRSSLICQAVGFYLDSLSPDQKEGKA